MLIDNKELFISKDKTIPIKGFRGLNFGGIVHFSLILINNYVKLSKFYSKALRKKECVIGPFYGEFGNFLLHCLPFLSHLYKLNVKIHFLCVEQYKPFLFDERNNFIIHEWVPIRDFFAESKPSGNTIKIVPEDVKHLMNSFFSKCQLMDLPILDLSESNLYWYSFRNWQLKKKQFCFDLGNRYGCKENAIAIFPRKKGGDFTPNNGGAWDYEKVVKISANYFDKVYVLGRPDMSENLEIEEDNIELVLTYDNTKILEVCSRASLIVTQHSGAMHLGSYARTDVLLIFKGKPPIKGLDDSLRFRKNLYNNKISVAFDYDEINTYLEELSKND